MGNFKRGFFFWIEKLNITRGERRFVVTSIVIFLAVWSADLLIPPAKPVDSGTYHTLDSLYQQYVTRIHKRDSLIHRYYYTAVDDSGNIASGVPFAIPGDTAVSRRRSKKEHSQLDSHSIDINHADSTVLTELPGIGPVIAGKIITYRNKYGRFSDLKSLKKVKGIGEKKFAKIRPYITLTSRKQR